MLINKIRIIFFTVLCFVFISCTVDVNQPVEVEESYVINAKDMFDSLVGHIGWRVTHTRLEPRTPTDGISYVELSIISLWEWTDDDISDDLSGRYRFDVYIQNGQDEEIKEAALSYNHRQGREKRLYYSNGTWAIQSIMGTPLNYVYSRRGGGTWSTEDLKFNSLDNSFGNGPILLFENNLNLINSQYVLSLIEEKEEKISMIHID